MFEKQRQAREKSQTASIERWWIPTDPIVEKRLITVLAKMAKCVLDNAEELPPPDGEILSQSGSTEPMGNSENLNK